MPRDRDGTFEPAIVRKRQRRLDGVDQLVLSLTAQGLRTGEVAAHFADVYGAAISKDTISRITEKVSAEMADWQNRPLDQVYPVIFIDAIVVKVRDGQVTNKPFYMVIGATTAGERDILGIWAGEGGEGAKFWLAVLTEIKNRGVADVCIVVCDGLKGLPDAITTTWELAQVQTCVIHLTDAMAKDLRPIYTAVNADQAEPRMGEFAEKWQAKYPAAVKLWRSAWGEFIPFLDYHVEIRKIISRDQRDRIPQRPVPARGPGPRAFPQRSGGPEMPVPGRPVPRPDRARPGTMGHALEGGVERLRDHLRRTHQPVDELNRQTAVTHVYRTLPGALPRI